MPLETIISFVAVGISAITLLMSWNAEQTKAKKTFVQSLKREVEDHEERIEKLEFLLQQCEGEREALRKEHYNALREIAELHSKIGELMLTINALKR